MEARYHVSVVIPTYRRERVLIDTLRAILEQGEAGEVLVVDQTESHDPETLRALTEWEAGGRVRVIPLPTPGTVTAMNKGLRLARGSIVLFLDDDIQPGAGLVAAHARAHAEFADAWAVAGQVLQPGENPTAGTGASRSKCATTDSLTRDFDFRFSSDTAGWVSHVMAGNLSVKREQVLAIGGFDENFIPPVAFRFETEFARRILRHGGKIRFEPSASIRHLRAAAGGTRVKGSHLTSASPVHGVGDYYYALCCGRGIERVLYMARRPFREVRTRFHLVHPWWIPVKLVGECRALRLAMALYRRGPRRMDGGSV